MPKDKLKELKIKEIKDNYCTILSKDYLFNFPLSPAYPYCKRIFKRTERIHQSTALQSITKILHHSIKFIPLITLNTQLYETLFSTSFSIVAFCTF